MTTATQTFGRYEVRYEPDAEYPGEDWGVFEDDDIITWHPTRAMAVKDAKERAEEDARDDREAREEEEREAREEADDARREELRAEIAELLENVTRIDSLEGLLKSVKRLQD